jgi:hypothetical protein
MRIVAGRLSGLLRHPSPVVRAGTDGSTFFNEDTTVTVQLVNSEGKCWTSAFAAADTKKNEADSFKAQAR